MAKPSTGLHTPRPSALRSSSSSCPSTRSSVGSATSSSAPAASKLPIAAAAAPRDFASNAKVVAKCLAYDDDDDGIALAAATLSPPDAVPEGTLVDQEEDLPPLLELPDPDLSADTSVFSAAPDDALAASADSCVTEVVPARADSTHDGEAPLPEEINVVLAELHGASGLSPRSKRLLAALAEAAAFELAPSAAARRLGCAAFWGKVRVAVLAGTLAAVVAVDVALGAYLYARRVNDRYHVLPPT